MTRPGDFSALWSAFSEEARREIDADVAAIVRAEQGTCCRRLRELVKQLPATRERRRLLAFLDVIAAVDVLAAAQEE
jgi:hypothetical protein